MSPSAPQLSGLVPPSAPSLCSVPARQPLVPAPGRPGSCMDKGVLCGLTAAGRAAGRWLRIADETEPFVVPPQAQYFFLGAGCVPGRADDGCARRRPPARQLSLPLIPAPLQRNPSSSPAAWALPGPSWSGRGLLCDTWEKEGLMSFPTLSRANKPCGEWSTGTRSSAFPRV